MKIPKMRSYFRLFLGFFILLASFNIIQFLFLRLLVIQNVPYYLKERHDVLLNIKNNILEEAKRDPHFDLEAYIAHQNKTYNRLKLDFVTKNKVEIQKVYHNHNFLLRVTLPERQNRPASAIRLQLPRASGYLVLYHATEYNRLNNGSVALAAFMLISIVLSLIAGFFMFQKIYWRSTQLVTAVEKISKGDYSVRTNISGNDEFGLLGKAFNDMAASIEKATQELKAIDQQRRRFVADISHELATPLTSIQGFVETLQMEELHLSPAKQQEYLKIVWEETERLSYLVKDLLELARIDAGTISLSYDRIDCQQFLKEFAKRNSLKLKGKQVELLWDAEPGQLIYADYRRLEQIFQNLLDNSLKHSDKLHKVEIIFGETERKTKILFRDDGSGIAEQHLARIFDSFYKVVNRPDQNSSSNGLGLSIVKRMVELHGGTITVESRINKGTTFIIEFPKISESLQL
ncbi:MAG: sensor histidine kinase [Bacillota bacterium]